MALLKKNGTLDIERINKLPTNEWMDLMGELTEEQFEEYKKKCPLNEGINSVMSYTVDCTMEEDMEKTGFIRLSDMLNNMKNRYGL